MSDPLKALMDRIALLEAQTFSTKSTLPPLVENPDGLPPMIFPGGVDYSDWAFGFSISGAVVTVNSGKVRHGTRTPVTVAGKDITIAADNTWIFVAYTYGSTATITNSTSEPVDTEEVHKHILFLVTLDGDTASVEPGDIKHLGDIFIPSAFA